MGLKLFIFTFASDSASVIISMVNEWKSPERNSHNFPPNSRQTLDVNIFLVDTSKFITA
jgi:hypothetical protein